MILAQPVIESAHAALARYWLARRMMAPAAMVPEIEGRMFAYAAASRLPGGQSAILLSLVKRHSHNPTFHALCNRIR